jgi:vitamin B12 transport system permease protein
VLVVDQATISGIAPRRKARRRPRYDGRFASGPTMLLRRLLPSPPLRISSVLAKLFAAVSALSAGVAAGVVWLMVSLFMRHGSSALTLPAGIALGWTLRWGMRIPGRWRGALAGLATLVAALWVNVAFVALQVAGNMGMGVIDTLRAAGPAMLWQLLRLGISPMDALWYALGIGLAIYTANRMPRSG